MAPSTLKSKSSIQGNHRCRCNVRHDYNNIFREEITLSEKITYSEKKPMSSSLMRMRSEESYEKWIKYYSSSHDILLVGEGDFSFSLCLGMAFGCATNIVATTLDSYDILINKYRDAKANLKILRKLGATVLHGVDATQMWNLPHLRCKKFHRIIYNFPHAGFLGRESDPSMRRMHKDLVRGFLKNAGIMVTVDGEIHVNHKANATFDRWRIDDLGSEFSLVCIAQDTFRIHDYPGYNNKRGSGSRADEPFPLGACITYRFRLHPIVVNNLMNRGVSVQQQPPVTKSQMFSPPPLTKYDEGVELQEYASECQRIFRRYLMHIDETFGDASYDVGRSVKDALYHGYEMYMNNAAAPGRGRPSGGFITILEELHRLSVWRSERLRQSLDRISDTR